MEKYTAALLEAVKVEATAWNSYSPTSYLRCLLENKKLSEAPQSLSLMYSSALIVKMDARCAMTELKAETRPEPVLQPH